MSENNLLREDPQTIPQPISTVQEDASGNKENPAPKSTARDNLYSRITVSKRTMDIIIGILVAALVVVFIIALR